MSEYIYGEVVVESHEYGGGVRTEIVKMGDRRERIVRCRDCERYDAEDGECMRDPEHTGRGWYARPDGLCAWGMPRKRGDRE